MFRNVFELDQQLFTLAKDVSVTKELVSDLQDDVRDLSLAMQALKAELDYSKREAAHEHENLILRLENALLKKNLDLSATDSAPKIEPKRRH